MAQRVKHNKYARTAEAELDLHGSYQEEAVSRVRDFLADCQNKNFSLVRVITGKGLHSAAGPVLKSAVISFLARNNYAWRFAKVNEGGEGALLIELK